MTRPSSDSDSSWHTSKALAAGILHDRPARRAVMARLLIAVLAILALGNWPLSAWLGASLWCFVIWWGVCAALTGFLLLMALYDALAVIREEREQLRSEVEDSVREDAEDPADDGAR